MFLERFTFRGKFFQSEFSRRSQAGFTLPEVLVAMSMLVLVIFAATGLYVASIRSNNENMHTLVGYGLAQEGIEAVRNIRDSNWLLNTSLDGTLSSGTIELWGARLPLQAGEEYYYTLDLGVTVPGQSGENTASSLMDYVPWKLTEVTKEEALNSESQTTLLHQFNNEEGFSRYGHEALGLQDTSSVFRRYIIMQRDPAFESNQVGPLRVISVVTWQEASRTKEIRLETQLTNWKER